MPRSKTRSRKVKPAILVAAPKISPEERLGSGLSFVRELFGEPGPLAKAAACAASVAYLYWFWLVSGFDRIAADLGDGRMMIVILEHWTQVWLGRVDFRNPPFFAGDSNVLGYTDSFVLHSIPYSLLRLIFDRYTAYHWTQVTLKVIGFYGAAALLERVWFPRSWAAVVGAVMFTVSAMQSRTIEHAQFATVAVLPWILLLAIRAWERRATRSGALSMAAAGALAGLVAFNAFYVAFFFALATAAVGLILLAANPRMIQSALSMWREWLAGAAAAGVALIPMLMTYLPVLKARGGWSSAQVVGFSLPVVQWLNPGLGSVFGSVFLEVVKPEHVNPAGAGLGFPWGTVALFTVSAIVVSWRGDRRMIALSAAAVILLLLTNRYGDWTPWKLLYDYVPGASAIRVISRISTIVFPMMIPVCLVGLLWLAQGLGQNLRWGMPVLVLLWAGEQFRFAPPYLSVTEERAKFVGGPEPPSSCRLFYIVNGLGDDAGRVNLDAMLIGATFHVPTLNGYSGLEPADWVGWKVDGDYPRKMEARAARHGLRGVCVYDFAAKRWQPAIRDDIR